MEVGYTAYVQSEGRVVIPHREQERLGIERGDLVRVSVEPVGKTEGEKEP